ncbi:MAG TPA: hypothetical protein VK174_12090, partial [Chitinophagales bacterium]|nr:hypothetical protein [Chitinophagales bacterium]
QFNFEIFRRKVGYSYYSQGGSPYTYVNYHRNDAAAMRRMAALGWNLTMGAQLPLFNHGNMFIGPQINFVDLFSFDKDERMLEHAYSKKFNYSLGLKVGFSFY